MTDTGQGTTANLASNSGSTVVTTFQGWGSHVMWHNQVMPKANSHCALTGGSQNHCTTSVYVTAVYPLPPHTQLDHPSIVHFHDSFLEGDSFFIATEFCEVRSFVQQCSACQQTLGTLDIVDTLCSEPVLYLNVDPVAVLHALREDSVMCALSAHFISTVSMFIITHIFTVG